LPKEWGEYERWPARAPHDGAIGLPSRGEQLLSSFGQGNGSIVLRWLGDEVNPECIDARSTET